MRENGSFQALLLSAFSVLGACGSADESPGQSSLACPDNLTPIANADYCKSQSSDVDCALVTEGQKYDSCGVALGEPPAPLLRSSMVQANAGTGDPQLSCFDAADYPEKAGTPQTVTVKGKATLFLHGCSSDNLTIEFHRVKRGGAEDGDIGDLIGAPLVTEAECWVNGVSTFNGPCDFDRVECVYEYAGVPTETELLIVTSGMKWTPLYEYGIFLRNADVKAGVAKLDVHALPSFEYDGVSHVGIDVTITAGYGWITGEVHDCGDVRLQNAVVSVDAGRAAIAYFDDQEEWPYPDESAQGTGPLGLHGVFDIAPGPVAVAAGGKDKSGEMVGLGFQRVRVFPSSVTAVTFRGMSPLLVP